MDIKKIYGPYTRKDKRQHVVIVYMDGTKRTVSYPKFLMEQKIGRNLDPDMETIDHINKDFNNNNESNLRIIPRSQHSKEDALRAELVSFICSWCKGIGTQSARHLLGNKKQGKAGPFCGKSCAATYSREVQLGKIKPMLNTYEEKERKYFSKKMILGVDSVDSW